MYYALDIYSKTTKKMFAYHSSDSRKDILKLKEMYGKSDLIYIKECYGETDADKQTYRESSKYGGTTVVS